MEVGRIEGAPITTMNLERTIMKALEASGVAPSPLETLVLPRLSVDNEEYSLNREAFERFSILFGQFT